MHQRYPERLRELLEIQSCLEANDPETALDHWEQLSIEHPDLWEPCAGWPDHNAEDSDPQRDGREPEQIAAE